MQISKLKVSKSVQEELISYLAESILFDYINISTEMTVLAKEEFYLRTTSEQLNLIIIKRVDSYLYIDLIGGAGGAGLFGISWGSEEAFVRRALKLLEDFCKDQGESIEIIE